MSWSHILGHDRVRDAFAQILRQGRLGHAYLLVGPAGVGKKLFARELARALLCENRQEELVACDVCSSCRMLTAGTHPDFFQVGRPEEKNEFPIEVMQELRASFALKSARGRGKVAIIDDADDFNDASANCFLKTLEEPPPGAIFFLIGSGKQQQLPTILSRCQLVRFAPLPSELVRQVLTAQGVTDEALRDRAVQLSGGSPGVALSLADPELWQFRGEFLKALAHRPFDFSGTSARWLAYIEEAGKEGALQRRRALGVVRLLIEFLRDVLAAALGGETLSCDATDAPLVQALGTRLAAETLEELIDRCMATEEQVLIYVPLALVIEGLLDYFAARLNAP